MVIKSFKEKVSKVASETATQASNILSKGVQKAGKLASDSSEKLNELTQSGTKMIGGLIERVNRCDIDFPSEMPDKKNLEKYAQPPDRLFNSPKEIFEYYADLFPGFQFHAKESKTSWYLSGDIPDDKLQNALFSFLGDVDEDELVILYHDSTQLGKGDDGAAITNKKIIIKPAMKDPISILFAEPYEIGYTYEDKVGDRSVTMMDNDIDKSLIRKNVEFFFSKGQEMTCFLNFGKRNTFPVIYFLTCLKERTLADQLCRLSDHRDKFYSGHLPRTLKDW